MIHVSYTKFDGSLHWHFTMHQLGSDEYGTWLGAPHGTPVQRGLEPPIVSPAFALLVPRHEWFSAVWNAGAIDTPFHYEVYADICSPAQWDGTRVTMVDLDLDVARAPGGRTVVLDEDEFTAHGARFGYPPDLIASARISADRLLALVSRREEPFDRIGLAYLERAAALRVGRS
jgi:protein associated with RNAse G/E